MRHFILLAVLLAVGQAEPLPKIRGLYHLSSTDARIRRHGYPAEKHLVQTADSYILTMFRIPYSHKLNNEVVPNKPVILLQHGLLSSSDAWLLNGPDYSLAYLLADAGYDVWMGNSRGNNYSRRHATKSPLLSAFWNFDWHEMGIYDLPAEIDYILYKTGANALHYVGHSQGTTSFFVMLSILPNYSKKIKTSHMLAPVAYMNHMNSAAGRIGGPLLGQPGLLSKLIGKHEFMPSSEFVALLGSKGCHDNSSFQFLCSNAIFLIAGWDSHHLNNSAIVAISETHPAGISTNQIIHYLQEYESGYFRQFDYGTRRNKKLYKSKIPPTYSLSSIKLAVPMHFYYSDNDNFAAVADVQKLWREIGTRVKMHHVHYRDWNHLDFLWGMEIKDVINDVIIHYANEYENNLN